jgi:alkylated DNA repair dioxygenase AlkB
VQVAASVALAVGYEPNNCLANYYLDGDSTMGYHSDSVAELETGTGISIVSLGVARAISFRREADRSEVHQLTLGSGSLLHMTAIMQSVWPAVGGHNDRADQPHIPSYQACRTKLCSRRHHSLLKDNYERTRLPQSRSSRSRYANCFGAAAASTEPSRRGCANSY